MKKFNLGHKMDTSKPVSSDEGKNKTYYPSIYISSKEVKGLKLKIGQKVNLIGVVTGVNERERDDKEKETNYDIDVEQLGGGMSEEEYMKLPDEKKDEYDKKDLEKKAKK
ncbi:MAG: hypothetical protein ABIG52_01320 [Nanoarchaeota archaeon]